MAMFLIHASEIERVRNSKTLALHKKMGLIADMCRLNALTAVKRAGSGHLGSSFSAMDIVVWLYYQEMNTTKVGFSDPGRDIYFSSKGHDVPGLYAVLYSLGILSKERFLKLRRLGGLDGHPDVGVPGIEANSGSLGMGISKGRGMAWAKRFKGLGGRVYVLCGDGELQEGQNYEAFQSAVQQKISNLTVIVDHNKLQSDKPVCEIVDLGDLEAKLKAFGWEVARCDGHDVSRIQAALGAFKKVNDRPQVLIADTIKGRGVSFMEHPTALKAGSGYYKWHAGAPDDAAHAAAQQELLDGIRKRFVSGKLGELSVEEVFPVGIAKQRESLVGEPESQGKALAALPVSQEYVADAFGKALVEIARRRKELVVLDGDLAADCRIREFELTFPDRFIECGIAEQDMVSMASGLARQGLLPVVNSFANFLAARANEQIYNNATERGKIIYACHYAGLIPAGPGKSHQSIRDISLFGALPDCTILQPCNAEEAKQAVAYFVDQAKGVCVMRLNIGPSPQVIPLPSGYKLTCGQGAVVGAGDDVALMSYGPVMLHEALVARNLLVEEGVSAKVINMPWLNHVDAGWLASVLGRIAELYIIEDHAPVGGLGSHIAQAQVACGKLPDLQLHIWSVEGFPVCGTPTEALKQHRLDGASLAQRILQSRAPALASVK